MSRPSAVLTAIEAAIEAIEPYTDTAEAVPRSDGDRFRRHTGTSGDPDKERGFLLEVTDAPVRGLGADKARVSLCGLLTMGLRLVVGYAWTGNVWRRVVDDSDALDAGLRAMKASVAAIQDVDVALEHPVEVDTERRRVLLQIPFAVTYSR